jgi:hypothetical protein
MVGETYGFTLHDNTLVIYILDSRTRVWGTPC